MAPPLVALTTILESWLADAASPALATALANARVARTDDEAVVAVRQLVRALRDTDTTESRATLSILATAVNGLRRRGLDQ